MPSACVVRSWPITLRTSKCCSCLLLPCIFSAVLPDALAAYARLTELQPDCSAYWCNYGTALMEGGAAAEAERPFATAIRLDKGNLMPKVQMGLLRARTQG